MICEIFFNAIIQLKVKQINKFFFRRQWKTLNRIYISGRRNPWKKIWAKWKEHEIIIIDTPWRKLGWKSRAETGLEVQAEMENSVLGSLFELRKIAKNVLLYRLQNFRIL